MSYSLTPQIKKSKSFSKYLYSNIDQTEDFFIFNIELISNKKKSKKIKKIKNSKSGLLLSSSDDIMYSKYQKILMEIINITNPDSNHSLEIKLENKSLIYKDNFIYLEISDNYNALNCFYNLDIN